MVRTLVLAFATPLLAACTPVGGSPARPSRVAECPVTLAFQVPPDEVIDWAGPRAIQAVRATRGFIASEITFPTACWEVTYRVPSRSVTFVVEVQRK